MNVRNLENEYAIGAGVHSNDAVANEIITDFINTFTSKMSNEKYVNM